MDQSLYRKIILEHNESAFHFGCPDKFDLTFNTQNQSCGDSFDMFLSFKEDQDTKKRYIEDLHFTGSGCALSKAVTSILSKKIYLKSVLEAKIILKEYIDAMNIGTNTQLSDPELSVFLPFRDKPSRKECCIFSAKSILEHVEE